MRADQWKLFKKAAKREAVVAPPIALIVDSPWIPGYVGIRHMDFFVDPEAWFQANLKVLEDFPEVIAFPSWWVEYGMAIEPSAFGNRIHFYEDRTPDQTPTLLRLEDVAEMTQVNPLTDGLMPFALQRYRMQKQRIFDAGYTIPVVAARGPLCVASFLRGVTPLMMDIAEGREEVHALFRLTTKAVIDWLTAQAETIGDSVEGILVLDDIAGFLSLRSYREYAHPYLKQICDAFPAAWVKVYHNDANVRPFLAELPDTGFDVLNWSDKIGVGEALTKTGGRMCLMGNVPPLDVGVRGTPEMVQEAAGKVLAEAAGGPLILSVGGGVSPGMPAANVHALARAVRE
ncbi:MAG: uroporphyrinogen decarboxylase family protein [Acidobacteria bacterium]|nr:uroporphyrinogen decarboxylase family protein [Acidobacteriota bacterium]